MKRLKTNKVDAIDWKILTILQENARLSFKEIGSMVNLTSPAVSERIKKMEEMEIITGYHASLNPDILGYQCRVIIRLSTSTHWPNEKVKDKLDSLPGIVNYWICIGEFDYIIEAIAPSLPEIEQLIMLFSQHGSTISSVVSSFRQYSSPVIPPEKYHVK